MPAEFTCCECSRDVTNVGLAEAPRPPLCLLCVEVPGWYRIPRMRAFLDADHDGREPWERGQEAS